MNDYFDGCETNRTGIAGCTLSNIALMGLAGVVGMGTLVWLTARSFDRTCCGCFRRFRV